MIADRQQVTPVEQQALSGDDARVAWVGQEGCRQIAYVTSQPL